MQSIPQDHDVVYVGCTETGYEVLDTIVDAGVPVTEVVTIPPQMGREHGVSGYQQFGDFAEEHGISVYHPERYSMDAEEDTEHFRQLDGDLMIVNGWQRLVPEEILETFTRGALGIHGSAFGLPKGRGRSPLNWSLIEDLDRFLLSLIRLAPGADSGGIAATRKFDVTEFDDIRSLYYKVAITTEEMLLDTVEPILAGDFEFEPQEGQPTYYPKRNPEDGEIPWRNTTRDVYNLVRAVAEPYPGAFTFDGDTRVMIWEAIPFSDDLAVEAEAGTVVRVFDTSGDFVVATADGTLLVTEWEAEDWTPREGLQFDAGPDHDRVDRPEHKHNLTSGGDS